jgi:hypothetical protein
MYGSISKYISAEEILILVDGFRNRTLPISTWTHEAHLITGLWFNYTYSDVDAICYLRSGIIAYNITAGGENTPEKGYHETLTLFWSKILRQFIAANRTLSLVDLCNRLLNSEWASKDLPLQFYTRDLLFSTKARAMWIKPTLKKFLEDEFPD